MGSVNWTKVNFIVHFSLKSVKYSTQFLLVFGTSVLTTKIRLIPAQMDPTSLHGFASNPK